MLTRAAAAPRSLLLGAALAGAPGSMASLVVGAPGWMASLAVGPPSRGLRCGAAAAAAAEAEAAAAQLPPHVAAAARPAPAWSWAPDAPLRVSAPPVVYHELYSAPQLPPGHRFPMGVFRRIHEALLADGVVAPAQVHTPAALPSREVLCLVHDAAYVDALCAGALDDAAVRRIGFGAAARSRVLIERTKAEVAGTILTAELALRHGLACNTAGGTHHAFPGAGSGYCLLNDLAVAAELLLAAGKVRRVAIVDLDVHQGDGTAFCVAGRRDVFTLSVHAESNFPARKQASTLDVGLPDGTGDDAYLAAVAGALAAMLPSFAPDLVLYDAGVDVHVDDALGRLAVTDEGLARREALVLDACLGAGVPVAGFVGGGYADDLGVLARRHCLLHRAAAQMWDDHGL